MLSSSMLHEPVVTASLCELDHSSDGHLSFVLCLTGIYIGPAVYHTCLVIALCAKIFTVEVREVEFQLRFLPLFSALCIAMT